MVDVKMVDINEMTSRDIMAIAAQVDFANSAPADIEDVKKSFEAAVQSIKDNGFVRMSAFVINVIGENAEGNIIGGYGSAGNSATLTTMIPYLEEQIRLTLKGAGSCGCKSCYVKTLMQLLEATYEMQQEAANRPAPH